ncbi:MAG: BtpA/SgcQ family protein [Abditibacteriales bacterium]|nr:BtpA/SgcQ family protein [Abditibacteriales bacterium]
MFRSAKPLIGMVHLLPLPGSVRFAGDLDAVVQRALEDAHALAQGGADGVLVENFGDAPFHKYVEPHTVAAMAIVVKEVVRAVNVPVGVNVLRNDAQAALAIAAAAGARFIRVNVHTGAMVTDQGIIEGCADETLRYRKMLGADVKIFADVFVKHAAPLGMQTLEQAAKDTAYRGLADALIITGAATGEAPALDDLRRVKTAVPDVPVFVGSGVNAENIGQILSIADGVIVGTSVKGEGRAENPVDVERVRRLNAKRDATR